MTAVVRAILVSALACELVAIAAARFGAAVELPHSLELVVLLGILLAVNERPA